METRVAVTRSGIRQAIAAVRGSATTRTRLVSYQPRRFLATPTSSSSSSSSDTPGGPIQAAPPINFGLTKSIAQAKPPPEQDDNDWLKLSSSIRIVPSSPSYFTGKPTFTDDLLHLSTLVRKYQTLPMLPPGEAPRVAWKTLPQYKSDTSEPVKSARYSKILSLLRRLNYIHPALMPDDVASTLQRYMRDVQPYHNLPKPILIDEHGRARGVGRRKASTAIAYVVDGDGQVLVNGQSLTEYFGRLHDRESAVWALKATERLDKYNVWAVVKGGGTTGQAEALTLAVSKALMVHEPALKPALRRAGCVTRDPRRVERKKPGKLKARAMPAWVKR